MKKSQMARVVAFDRLVRGGAYPNRAGFGVDYGISERTIARDIEFLRDRLEAPLEFDGDRRGYFYTGPWELPSVVTMAATREDLIASLIEQLKVLSDAERDLVVSSVGFPARSNSAASNEPVARAVA